MKVMLQGACVAAITAACVVAAQADGGVGAITGRWDAGNVRAVHSGFASPASGEFNTQLKQDFTSRTEKLLAEKTTASAALPIKLAGQASAEDFWHRWNDQP